jgi:regulator of protease activity HflC (stomatin/prohibitin superfamily)
MLRRSTRRFFPNHASSSFSSQDFIIPPPRNVGLIIVPQGMEMVVERLGRYSSTLRPGISMLVPFLDRVRYVYSTKEQGLIIPPNQAAITKDNVVVNIDGVLFLKIVDAQKASYNIDNPIFNLINLAQTAMRSEIGKLTLDKLFEEREALNASIVRAITKESDEWGIDCKRYEIRDISVSDIVRQSMDLQAEAERKKRKAILESEGEMTARVNAAKGERLAQEELANAAKYAQITAAEAGAQALHRSTEAVAASLKEIAKVMQDGSTSVENAVSFRLAEQYIEQFGHIAKQNNTVVLSQNIGEPTQMVANALSMFGNIKKTTAANLNNSNNSGSK